MDQHPGSWPETRAALARLRRAWRAYRALRLATRALKMMEDDAASFTHKRICIGLASAVSKLNGRIYHPERERV